MNYKMSRLFTMITIVISFALLSIFMVTGCSKSKEKNKESVRADSIANAEVAIPKLISVDKFGKQFKVDQREVEFEKAKKFNIKKIKQYSIFPEKKLVEEILFNKKGQRTEDYLYVGTGTSYKKWVYKYDDAGREISMEIRDSKNNVLASQVSKYDNNGLETERVYADARQPGEKKFIFTYDNNGNNVETSFYSSSDSLIYKEVSGFRNNVLINSSFFDPEGKPVQVIKRIYSDTTNTFREVTTNTVRKRVATTITNYKFDTNGRLIEIKSKNMDRKFMYNENGDLVLDESYAYGVRKIKLKYFYFPNGLLKETIRYSVEDKPVIRSVYEYEYYKISS